MVEGGLMTVDGGLMMVEGGLMDNNDLTIVVMGQQFAGIWQVAIFKRSYKKPNCQ